MMSTPQFIVRRRRALQAAADLLNEFDIDQEQPVDVFEVIERLELWLVFQPLKSLLGAVIPQGGGGIMLTTEREPAIQRYTAAHEIGHWKLDYNSPAFDTDFDIFNPGASERERVAQWFASYFLMPPPLVHATVSRHVRAGTDLSPEQAYLIARDMRVSYEAALRQMANLNIISDHHRDALIAVPRLRAKQTLAYGHRPEIGVADVWPVDGPSAQHTVQEVDLVVNDEIVVALPENRTTGYRWLDETANARRSAMRARPAPPAFAPPVSSSAAGSPKQHPPPRTTADVAAALALLPPPQQRVQDESPDDDAAETPSSSSDQHQEGLRVVFDDYRPGWARIIARDAAPVRRHIAGAPLEAADFLAPSTEVVPTSEGEARLALPDPANPGAGATGQRLLALQARAEGQFTYVLAYAAVHDPRTPPAATFTVEATVNPPPVVLHRRALLEVDLDDHADHEAAARTDSTGATDTYRDDPGRRDETDL